METIHVMVTVGELLFEKEKEEKTTDGWLLDSSAGAWDVQKRTSIHTTEMCIHSLIG